MSWLKSAWNWICGAVRTLLGDVLTAVVKRAKEMAADTDLMGAALDAVMAAAHEGLTGDKAWVAARDKLVAKLAEIGKEVGDTAIDTALQSTYDAWKALGKPEA